MEGFVDETTIEVSSGNGGAGCVSFRREKYVPFGGPDGGDGGRGGDVIFQVKENLRTLAHLRMKRVFHAQNGRPGMGCKMHGKDGESIVIPVPPGTILRDKSTGEILKDFSESEESVHVFLPGGRGGQGNWHFRSSKHQTPRFAQPGMPGQMLEITVELQIIADIGFVGFPNAGKSTLLSLLTNAHPKIGPYPFTTKIPNLGVMYYKENDVVLADIPGIIEGAAQGHGLGLQFLKHVSRTRGLAYLIDLSDINFLEAFETLQHELQQYSPELAQKPRILIGSKTDLDEDALALNELKKKYPGEKVLSVSSFARENLEDLKKALFELAAAP